MDSPIVSHENWISWEAWVARERDRIFAEAKLHSQVNRRQVSNVEDHASPFQRRFFLRLESLQANSESDLIEQGRRLGILPECCSAYWRATHRPAEASSVQMSTENVVEEPV
jgi:hypothetical protein